VDTYIQGEAQRQAERQAICKVQRPDIAGLQCILQCPGIPVGITEQGYEFTVELPIGRVGIAQCVPFCKPFRVAFGIPESIT